MRYLQKLTELYADELQRLEPPDLRDLLPHVVLVRERARLGRQLDSGEDPRSGTGRLALLEAMHVQRTGQSPQSLSTAA